MVKVISDRIGEIPAQAMSEVILGSTLKPRETLTIFFNNDLDGWGVVGLATSYYGDMDVQCKLMPRFPNVSMGMVQIDGGDTGCSVRESFAASLREAYEKGSVKVFQGKNTFMIRNNVFVDNPTDFDNSKVEIYAPDRRFGESDTLNFYLERYTQYNKKMLDKSTLPPSIAMIEAYVKLNRPEEHQIHSSWVESFCLYARPYMAQVADRVSGDYEFWKEFMCLPSFSPKFMELLNTFTGKYNEAINNILSAAQTLRYQKVGTDKTGNELAYAYYSPVISHAELFIRTLCEHNQTDKENSVLIHILPEVVLRKDQEPEVSLHYAVVAMNTEGKHEVFQVVYDDTSASSAILTVLDTIKKAKVDEFDVTVLQSSINLLKMVAWSDLVKLSKDYKPLRNTTHNTVF